MAIGVNLTTFNSQQKNEEKLRIAKIFLLQDTPNKIFYLQLFWKSMFCLGFWEKNVPNNVLFNDTIPFNVVLLTSMFHWCLYRCEIVDTTERTSFSGTMGRLNLYCGNTWTTSQLNILLRSCSHRCQHHM